VYGKYITRSSKIHAHDEQNTCNVGDTVMVAESRPLSRTKTWKLVEVVESATQV
jgi:small subunit ribosomal protein S17